MDKQEFLQRLKEDKWFENPQELIDYRLPVVQFYLNNYTNTITIVNNQSFSSKDVVIQYNKDTDFTLVNEAFLMIKEKF